MITAAEAAMLIKLGGDIDIAEYGLTLEDMVPYFDCETTAVAKSIYKTVDVIRMKDQVSFHIGLISIKQNDIIETKEKLL